MAEKIKFRWHKGGLHESMQTMQEFDTQKAMEDYIRKEMAKWCIDDCKFTYDYAGHDDRIGWDTWYVCVNGKCCGMADFGININVNNKDIS